MRLSFLLLFTLALPLTVRAQADLEGAWVLTFMMDDRATQTMNLNADVAQDTLHLAMVSDHGEQALDRVSFNDNVLRFDFSTGHGSIACTLYRKDDEEVLSGICEGSMGEIPTTMTRPSQNGGSP